MPNQLAYENSPYLLQHANNPVNWFPWGEEALQKARAEQKPIFLSIGYAACHWCHVMEHESFENEATAALMNQHFVNIKVDREERPDLDSIYMAATVALTGSGGWPMSVFLTPDDLRPFYAGTYFPPEPRYNMPSFPNLLMGIASAWHNQREEIFRVGAQVAQHILSASQATESSHPLTNALLNNAADHLVQSYDWGFGGWGQAPKFPHPMTIEFLLSRATLPNADSKYLKTAAHALSSMARGGMYDVVGGGFARYSVDHIWRTPHFEKMLYDNAQLALAYLHAYLLTKELSFRRVCEETLDFMLREMSHPAGGFYSSLDADSEGEEGKFYVWDQAEIETTLGEDADFFKAAYAITPGGNFEGKTILQRALDDGALAARFKLPVAGVAAKLSDCHSQLLTRRSTRIRPGTDDKIITAWNALALQAFAEAGRCLQRDDYTAAAIRNANFLLENLYTSNRLLRSWRNDQAKHNAYLEDYASLALALIALYQSDPNVKWYSAALNLADEMVTHYADPQGGFFDTRDDHETLLLRPKDTQDNATPSGSALAAHLLLQLAAYGDRPDGRKTAEEMLTTLLEDAVRYPTTFSKWLTAADFALGPTYEIAIIGDPANSQTAALLQTLRQTHRPRQVTAISNQLPLKGGPALLMDRPLYRNQPTAYVCQGFVCQQPVNDAEAFAAQLGDKPTE